MPITTEARKPLYALVGANDLAVEKLREGFTKVQTRGAALQERIQDRVVTLPREYKTLPTTVKTYADNVTDKATAVYGDLTDRGEKLVAQIRRRPATRTAKTQARQAKTSAKATKTSTTKAAKSTAAAVSQAASQVG